MSCPGSMRIAYRFQFKVYNKMKIKTLIKTVSLIVIFIFGVNFASADATDINLTIRSGGNMIFSGTVPLPPTGTVEINSYSLDLYQLLLVYNKQSNDLDQAFQPLCLQINFALYTTHINLLFLILFSFQVAQLLCPILLTYF